MRNDKVIPFPLHQPGAPSNGLGYGRILRIRFAEADDLRIRKVITRSGARPRRKYPSWKMRRMIHCRSIHERNTAALLDLYPTYTEFFEEHAEIHYVMDGTEHYHYPDIYVRRGHMCGFIEVKEKEDAEDPMFQLRTAVMRQLLPAKGYQYYVVTGEDVGRQPRLSNAELIKRLRREPTLPEYEGLRRWFAERGFVTWQEVLDGALGPKGRAYIFWAYLCGLVIFDIDQPMSGSSLIEWVRPFHRLPRLVV